jgi:PAS domain-containing protein
MYMSEMVQQLSPRPDLRGDPSFVQLLTDSYRRLAGGSLVPETIAGHDAARWLYEDAPFALLAHDASSDPIFIYGNREAQRKFEYTWEELVRLPSRLSAEKPEREARERFLRDVARYGYVAGYGGIRVAKSGRRFRIGNATVWQLIDSEGSVRGQAAILPFSIDL